MSTSIIVCKQCTLSSRVPEIVFNEDGICSECVKYNKNPEPNLAIPLRKMEDGFARVSQESRPYHALVRFSGGKDSAYLLQLLKEHYKMRPLAFGVIHPFVNELAEKNMDSVARKLNVDLIKFYVDEPMFRQLMHYALVEGQKHGLKELVGCDACAYVYRWVSYRMAMMMKIPYVVDGTDPTQTVPPGYVDGPVIKAALEKGLSTYGNMPDVFRAACGDAYRGSIYEIDYEQVKNEAFPTTIAMFTILGYDYKRNYQSLEKAGIASQKSMLSSLTNCEAYHLFSYLSYRRYGYLPYEKTFAIGVRRKIASHILQFGMCDAEDTNRAQVLKILEDYRNAIDYIAQHPHQTDIEPLRKLCPSMSSSYDEESFAAMMSQAQRMHYYADYFGIDLKAIVS